MSSEASASAFRSAPGGRPRRWYPSALSLLLGSAPAPCPQPPLSPLSRGTHKILFHSLCSRHSVALCCESQKPIPRFKCLFEGQAVDVNRLAEGSAGRRRGLRGQSRQIRPFSELGFSVRVWPCPPFLLQDGEEDVINDHGASLAMGANSKFPYPHLLHFCWRSR